MTNILRKSTLSIAFGIVVTIALAWLSAIYAELDMFSDTSADQVSGVRFPSYVPGNWHEPEQCWTYRSQNRFYRMTGLTTMVRSKRDNPVVGVGVWFREFGWPMPAMRWVEMTIADGPDLPEPAERTRLLAEFDSRAGWRRGWTLPPGFFQAIKAPPATARPRLLPLLPAWPGILIDSMLLAGGFGAAVYLPGVALRRARFLRGECVGCGYPLSSSTCSECGHVHAARLISSDVPHSDPGAADDTHR